MADFVRNCRTVCLTVPIGDAQRSLCARQSMAVCTATAVHSVQGKLHADRSRALSTRAAAQNLKLYRLTFQSCSSRRCCQNTTSPTSPLLRCARLLSARFSSRTSGHCLHTLCTSTCRATQALPIRWRHAAAKSSSLCLRAARSTLRTVLRC